MRIFYPGTAPAGEPELRPDQLEALERIKREVMDPKKSGSVLVGAGMGSGKTVLTVEVMLAVRPKRCLIVGVRDAYSQWAKTLKEQGGAIEMRRITNTKTGQENLARLLAGESGLFYAGLEMLRTQDWEMVSETHKFSPAVRAIPVEGFGDFMEPVAKAQQKHTYRDMAPVDLLISDESHKHSNQKTAAIKTMQEIPARKKIALSGTFFGNKFENAWSVTCWLWGEELIGPRTMWEAEWCKREPVKTKWGKRVRTPKGWPLSKIVGERNPGAFVKTLPCYVFIATPVGAVPSPEILRIDLGAEQFRQYAEMESQSLTWIPSTTGKSSEALIADLPIVQRIRLRTAALGGMTLVPGVDEESPDSITFMPGCNSSTLNAAYDVLHRPSWAGKKALILTHSKQFAIEAARRIGQKYSVALKTGDTPSKRWDAEKARFMLPVSETGSIQYLVAVISAVGTATDGLQANCAKVLWLSEDDSNVNNIQGANRVWRDGVDLEEYESVKIVQRGTIAEGVLTKNRAHKIGVLDSIQGAA